VPVIKVIDSDYKKNRTLLLKHDHDGRDLQLEYAEKTLQFLQQLWGHDVALETVIDQRPNLLCFADNKLAIKPSA
jgi:stage V sporulation protein R